MIVFLILFLLQSLSQRLDEFVEDPSLVTGNPNIIKLPPNMVPVPCKPLFFDLALNHVTFPSLVDNMESKKSAAGPAGITGFVKGLWGWGGKKWWPFWPFFFFFREKLDCTEFVSPYVRCEDRFKCGGLVIRILKSNKRVLADYLVHCFNFCWKSLPVN